MGLLVVKLVAIPPGTGIRMRIPKAERSEWRASERPMERQLLLEGCLYFGGRRGDDCRLKGMERGDVILVVIDFVDLPCSAHLEAA